MGCVKGSWVGIRAEGEATVANKSAKDRKSAHWLSCKRGTVAKVEWHSGSKNAEQSQALVVRISVS